MYIYTIFKAENQEIQFLLLCTKPNIDKHKFLFFKGLWSCGRFIGQLCLACAISSADLSANRVTIVELSGSFYRPQTCQLDKIFMPIYRLTATKGLSYVLINDNLFNKQTMAHFNFEYVFIQLHIFSKKNRKSNTLEFTKLMIFCNIMDKIACTFSK